MRCLANVTVTDVHATDSSSAGERCYKTPLRLTSPKAGASGHRLDSRQHGGGVSGHFHLVPDIGDLAVRRDEEGGAFDAHVFPAVEAFLAPDAIGFKHGFGFVG